jgi:hypothetical protein
MNLDSASLSYVLNYSLGHKIDVSFCEADGGFYDLTLLVLAACIRRTLAAVKQFGGSLSDIAASSGKKGFEAS